YRKGLGSEWALTPVRYSLSVPSIFRTKCLTTARQLAIICPASFRCARHGRPHHASASCLADTLSRFRSQRPALVRCPRQPGGRLGEPAVRRGGACRAGGPFLSFLHVFHR